MIITSDKDGIKCMADVSDYWSRREIREIKEDDERYIDMAKKKTKSIAIEYVGEDGEKVTYSGVDEVFGAIEDIDYRAYAFLASYLFKAISNLFLSGTENISVS